MHRTTFKSKNTILYVFAIPLFLFLSYLGNAQVGINTITPISTLEINGSLSQKVEMITATTTLGSDNNTLVCNNGATIISIILPSVSSPDCAGRIFALKKGSMMDGTVDVTINGYGRQTIGGSATFLLSDDQGDVTIANDRSELKIISDHLSPYKMGEVNYFGTTGTILDVTGLTTDGTTNMVFCAVSTPAATNLQSMPTNEFSTNNYGRLVYKGETTRTFHIAWAISATPSTSGDEYIFGLAKKGVVVASSKIIQKLGSTTGVKTNDIQIVVIIAKEDNLESYLRNITDSADFSFNTFNLVAIGMPDYT